MTDDFIGIGSTQSLFELILIFLKCFLHLKNETALF